MENEESNERFSDLVQATSIRLWQLANQGWITNDEVGLTPEDACKKHTVFAFARLAESVLSQLPGDHWTDADIGAIAHTAQEHFKHGANFYAAYAWMPLLMNSLKKALEIEWEKVEYPVTNYDDFIEKMLDKTLQKNVKDDGHDDPQGFGKFAQNVLTKAVLRVRGIDTEVRRAITEFVEFNVPVFKTPDEFEASLSHLPAEIRERELAGLVKALNEQSTRSPETVARLLEIRRNNRILFNTKSIHDGFEMTIDHAIRCAIAATLYVSMQYNEANFAAMSGQPEDVIEKLLPSEGEIKGVANEMFSSWLVKVLRTRAR